MIELIDNLEEKIRKSRKNERINGQITAYKVRLIDENGKQVGIVSLDDALSRAKKASLDLVEIASQARPPVCKILDYGKFCYDKEKKKKKSRKKSRVKVKQIKYTPNTQEHDYDFKLKNAIKFLEKGNIVKFTIWFRGRQMVHKDLGYDVLNQIKEDLKEIAKVTSNPKFEGYNLNMTMMPKN